MVQCANPGSALMQRFGGAGFCAFVTENALSCVFSLARFFVDFDIHRTNLQAFATMDAFIFITMDAQKRKVAHRLEKYRNRTQILAECAVIFKYKGQNNTGNIVNCIPGKKHSEHDLFQMSDFHQKQAGNHCQG